MAAWHTALTVRSATLDAAGAKGAAEADRPHARQRSPTRVHGAGIRDSPTRTPAKGPRRRVRVGQRSNARKQNDGQPTVDEGAEDAAREDDHVVGVLIEPKCVAAVVVFETLILGGSVAGQ